MPRAPVSWTIKAKWPAPIFRNGCPIRQLPPDVLAEKLASSYRRQDASTELVRRNVSDFEFLDASLDTIVVECPSPTDEAPQHLCLDKGHDNEPRRDALLERGYIVHIRSTGEGRDEAGRGVTRRGDGWWGTRRVGYRSVGRSWFATRRTPPSPLSSVSLPKPSPSYAPLAPSWRPVASGNPWPDA